MKWPDSINTAKKVQDELRQKVRTGPLGKKIRVIAGVDAAFSSGNVMAAACLLSFPDLEHLMDSSAVSKIRFPYIPGFLSFREGPAIIKAIKKLRPKPDILIFDGQGIAHPKGMGIASHIGALLDIPSIGCAKSRLVGDYKEPGTKKGRYSDLIYQGRTIGAVLRTRDNTRPVFISPGHRTDIKGSVEIILRCSRGFRIPEPLRLADRLSKRSRRTCNPA